MTDDVRVLALGGGDLSSFCTRLAEEVARVPAGGTLYVMGPPALRAVMEGVRVPGVGPWRILTGPRGCEAWARKDVS